MWSLEIAPHDWRERLFEFSLRSKQNEDKSIAIYAGMAAWFAQNQLRGRC